MPVETQQAVDWALQQTYTDETGQEYPITANDIQRFMDKVREYFNTNSIEYTTFIYNDLEPFLSN
jgi:hypothetical protein